MTYYRYGWVTRHGHYIAHGIFCLAPMADIFTCIPSYLATNGEHAAGMDGLEFV